MDATLSCAAFFWRQFHSDSGYEQHHADRDHTHGAAPAQAEVPAPVYPAAGRPGPASARGGRLRLPAHL